ncbi:cytosolic endo-beta-N-acetylglucosaminidase 1-like [Mercurialis annua]|uniref:cytosolic endo-beta-N-acetylglucosaminidase 1-like n=1 Tax=Mercurialis annua TaxID=3986 RepID=UPI00215F39FC|nr:cytosolic endo-beta-N-acetylglucosaminidase 1-like [Mercurialis annua]
MSHTNEKSSSVDFAPFDPLQPSKPISYPIKTLEELHSRAYFESFHCPFNKASVLLPFSAVELPHRPRLLVCHDLQGGYGDDQWVQGGSNGDAYAIWHWHLIDVFVYFSHSLVTLPPPCWINTAHKHGVKVLGTFITEWDEGRLISNKLLETEESARMYAERLSELAVALGFDGWLINMEIKLDEEQIPNLTELVSHLTKTMHSSLPGSLVIWYDAITIHGKLDWQDQLNEKNKPFFDVCDGIFVNYTWKKNYPAISAAVAGNRKFDVYMGVDVFGRNTYGGGQWNTNVALDVCKEDDVSAAIFAPGWVYETKQPPDFQTAQNKWWSLVEKSWGRVKLYPDTLPFYSNFDQGHGSHVSVEGRQVSNTPWNNISSQGFQPFLEFKSNPSPDTIQVHVDFKEASYGGGANITFKGTLKAHNDFTTRLFQGKLLLGESPLYLTYSVKLEGDSQLGLALYFSSNLNETTSVLIAPIRANQISNNFNKVIMPRRVNGPEAVSGWVILESSIEMNGYTLTEIHALCYKPNPEHGKLRSESWTDLHRAYGSSPSEYLALLGDIKIRNSEASLVFPPSSSWLVEGQYIKWSSDSQGSKTLSVKINWKLKDASKIQFSKYNIYVEKLAKNGGGNSDGRVEGIQEYIGVAYVDAYYVSDISVPSSTCSVKFIIQMCGVDGACQKLDDSPFLQINVEDSDENEIAIPIDTFSLKTYRTDINPARSRSIKHKNCKHLIVELVQRVGKMERQMILKQRGLSLLLVMSLVLLGMIYYGF